MNMQRPQNRQDEGAGGNRLPSSFPIPIRCDAAEAIVKRADAVAAQDWINRNLMLLPMMERAFFYAARKDRKNAIRCLGKNPNESSRAYVELLLGNAEPMLEMADAKMAEFEKGRAARGHEMELFSLGVSIGSMIYKVACQKPSENVKKRLERYLPFLEELGLLPYLGIIAAIIGKTETALECRNALMEQSGENETKYLEGKSPEFLFVAMIDNILENTESAQKLANRMSAYRPSPAWLVYAQMNNDDNLGDLYELIERISNPAEKVLIAAHMGNIKDGLEYLKTCCALKSGAYFTGNVKEAYAFLNAAKMIDSPDEFFALLGNADGAEIINKNDGFRVVLENNKVRITSFYFLDAFCSLFLAAEKIISETKGVMGTGTAERADLALWAQANNDSRLLTAINTLFQGKAAELK